MCLRPPNALSLLPLALAASLWAMTKVDDFWKGQLMLFSWALLVFVFIGTAALAYMDRQEKRK